MAAEEIGSLFGKIAALGIDVDAGSRFAIYRDHLTAQHRPSKEFRAYMTTPGGRRLAFEAGSQIMQLHFSSTIWEKLERAPLRALLREILEGPPIDPGDDDRPRNKLLELVAAVSFADKFSVSLVKNAEDVRLLSPDGKRGAVECKRPKTFDNILGSLNEIGRQLRTRSGSDFGVAAIGGDRIAELASSEGVEAETAEEADGGMSDIATVIRHVVERKAQDEACTLLPSADYAVVILTAAVLVRKPFFLRPTCRAVNFTLSPAGVPGTVWEAFRPREGGPLARYLTQHTTVTVRKGRPDEPKG